MTRNSFRPASCFVAGTRVRMADGSLAPIEGIRPGEAVLGRGGRVNAVVAVERVPLGARRLYGFNGARGFVTDEQPFMTHLGWRSLSPPATREENPMLEVGRLREGDRLLAWTASPAPSTGARSNLALVSSPAIGLDEVALTRIQAFDAPSVTTLYNLLLDGDHAYFANDFLVHNKGGGDRDADAASVCGPVSGPGHRLD